MLKSGFRSAALIAALSLVSADAFAQQPKSNSDKAIEGLTDFAIGYAGWIWEERCHKLDTAKHEAFKTLVSEQLLRLNAIFEPNIVGAATGAGRDTANKPEYESCTGQYADFGDFGYKMLQDTAEALKPLPADFRVKVTR
jgi:hypothetical protein